MARAMKDSGIAWIGEIPEEWEIRKLKYCSSFIQDKYDDTYGDLSYIGLENIVSWNGKYIETESQYDKSQSLVFCKNDILWGKLRPYLAKVYHCSKEGCCSGEFCVIRVSDEFDVRYFWNMLISSEFVAAIDRSTYGTKMPRANADFMRNTYIPIPTRDEQERIAQFLDAECTRIDAVIEQTRASIEEYKKLKQAVITQAVTKGIRPNRPMKDSGVDWIGMVPNDWQVTKLKYFASIRSGITLGKVYPAGTNLVEYPYLRVANVQGSYTDLRDVATIAVTEEEADKYRLHYGELLMTEGGDRDKLGRGAVWHGEIDPCLHQNHVFALRTNDKLLAEYVSYLSDSTVGRDYFDVTANQSVHLASTNSTTILNFIIPYPSINEQSEIVAFLDQETSEIDTVMHSKQRLLSSLDCLKRSIINEYVTGKKEVFSC